MESIKYELTDENLLFDIFQCIRDINIGRLTRIIFNLLIKYSPRYKQVVVDNLSQYTKPDNNLKIENYLAFKILSSDGSQSMIQSLIANSIIITYDSHLKPFDFLNRLSVRLLLEIFEKCAPSDDVDLFSFIFYILGGEVLFTKRPNEYKTGDITDIIGRIPGLKRSPTKICSSLLNHPKFPFYYYLIFDPNQSYGQSYTSFATSIVYHGAPQEYIPFSRPFVPHGNEITAMLLNMDCSTKLTYNPNSTNGTMPTPIVDINPFSQVVLEDPRSFFQLLHYPQSVTKFHPNQRLFPLQLGNKQEKFVLTHIFLPSDVQDKVFSTKSRPYLLFKPKNDSFVWVHNMPLLFAILCLGGGHLSDTTQPLDILLGEQTHPQVSLNTTININLVRGSNIDNPFIEKTEWQHLTPITFMIIVDISSPLVLSLSTYRNPHWVKGCIEPHPLDLLIEYCIDSLLSLQDNGRIEELHPPRHYDIEVHVPFPQPMEILL